MKIFLSEKCFFITTIIFSALLISITSSAQITSKGLLRSEPNIEILVKNVEDPCNGTIPKSTYFQLKSTGLQEKYRNTEASISLTIFYMDCRGKKQSKFFSIDIKSLANGITPNNKWSFTGSSFLDFNDKIIKKEQNIQPKKEPVEIAKPKCENKLPSEILANKIFPIKKGESVTLSIPSGDGNLCQGAKWVWYKDECGTNEIFGTGGKITDFPTKNTYYFVRAEAGKNVTECKSFYVEVQEIDKETLKPVRYKSEIVGAPSGAVCPGTDILLKAVGGLSGTKKRWAWYANDCNGTPIEIGREKITVKPEQDTKYFVRDLNDKEQVDCSEEVSISVMKLTPIAPIIINNGQSSISICEGEEVFLRVDNYRPDIKYKWFTDTLYQSNTSTTNLTVKPKNSVKYFVQGEGQCGAKSDFRMVEITVNEKTKQPKNIFHTYIKGKSYKLTLEENNALEEGGVWKWYLGKQCEGEFLGKGREIIHNIKQGNIVSVRAEGGQCGTTLPKAHIIPIAEKSKNFGFINVGAVVPNLTNLSFTLGYGMIYVKYKTGIKNSTSNFEIEKDASGQYSIPAYPIHVIDYYEYNGQTSTKRSGFTGGVFLGKKSTFLYLGAGVGEFSPMWGIDIVSYTDPTNKKTNWGTLISERRKGPEFEAGLLIKLDKFNIMGGVNLIKDKVNGMYIDGNIGVGITF